MTRPWEMGTYITHVLYDNYDISRRKTVSEYLCIHERYGAQN